MVFDRLGVLGLSGVPRFGFFQRTGFAYAATVATTSILTDAARPLSEGYKSGRFGKGEASQAHPFLFKRNESASEEYAQGNLGMASCGR